MEALDKNLLNTIENIANLGFYEVDLQTGMWVGSDNFISIFGLPQKEEYTQEEFQAIVHPDDVDDVMNFFQCCLREQKDFNYEYRCIRQDGKVIFVNSRSKIFFADDGTPLNIIGIKQDITDKELFEKKLLQLNRLLKKKDDILGEVAHDLRAPLAQIMILTTILEKKLHGEAKGFFNMLKETSKTAENIVKELTEIAHLRNFDIELNKSKTNINEILQRSINCFKLQLQQKNLCLKTSFAKKTIAFIDEKKMLRVFNNLLSNAIKFTPEKGTIHISTKVLEDKVLIIVKDEGIGIKQEYIPLLFDTYSGQIKRPGTKGEKSTGLGLSIVKHILDLHQAEISVESEVDKGTEIVVALSNGKNML